MKIWRKMAAAGLSLVLTAGILAGCGSSSGSSGTGSSSDSGQASASGGTLKIAVAAPLTGESAQDGQAIEAAVKLAAKQVNEAGGIDGMTVEVVSEDDKGDASEAATVANKLAQDSSVLAVVGHFNSSCTLAGAPIYNGASLVEVSPGSSAASVTDAGDYVFRVITTDAVQGNYLAQWCVNDLGYKKVAILYENTDYGLGLANVMDEEVSGVGAAVVAKEAYEVGAQDFSTLLTKVQNAGADVLVIGGLYNETASIAKQMVSAGLGDIQIMGVDAIYSPALIDLGGDATEGIKLTGYFSVDDASENVQSFVAAYNEEYGENPGTYAAYAYDAANIIFEAMKNGAQDREAIQQYLSTLADYQGVTGVATFDENGDIIKAPLRMQIEGGEFVIVEQ